MDQYIGEIRLLPYTFAPDGWQDCDGSLLSISDNDALFALIGTTYGGDGQNTFAVPDLRGRVPVHAGTGPGLSTYTLGQMAGSENVTLIAGQLGAHSHPVTITNAQDTTGTPAPGVEPGAVNGDVLYTGDIAGSNALPLAGTMIAPAGGNQPHDNTMPTLTVRFCIALSGVYPPQP